MRVAAAVLAQTAHAEAASWSLGVLLVASVAAWVIEERDSALAPAGVAGAVGGRAVEQVAEPLDVVSRATCNLRIALSAVSVLAFGAFIAAVQFNPRTQPPNTPPPPTPPQLSLQPIPFSADAADVAEALARALNTAQYEVPPMYQTGLENLPVSDRYFGCSIMVYTTNLLALP
jgi:hypothetical protein